MRVSINLFATLSVIIKIELAVEKIYNNNTLYYYYYHYNLYTLHSHNNKIFFTKLINAHSEFVIFKRWHLILPLFRHFQLYNCTIKINLYTGGQIIAIYSEFRR